MSKSLRQSQSFLHTWSGMLLGWILFLVFVTGTIAFWREGMNRWMRPELARVEQPMQVLAATQRFLARKAPDAQSWFITMPSERSPGAQTFWIPAEKKGEAPRGRRGRRGRGDTQALIGADGQVSTARETRGGDFFYRFHFDLHYMPVIWARWLVGVAAMMMLVAILSGIVTHKKIFRDFFTLRRHKGQRSWLDGHNASAVLALPFHLMMTYTGLVTLMALLMPWAVVANYTDQTKVAAHLFPTAGEVTRANRPAPLVPLTRVVADAEGRLGGPIGYIEVSDPGDAAARITLGQSPASTLSARSPRLAYDGVSGRLIWRAPDPGAASATAGVMVGLHAGRFADTGLRWIYFLCGVAGTLMVASGLVLWTVKRREKLPDPARPHLGFRIVDGLNVAVIGGFPFGIAAFLWANRLLPVGLKGRAEWEVHCLFIVWALAFAVTLLASRRVAWTTLLAGTGALLIGLPVYNALATRHGLLTSLVTGDFMLAGIDTGLLVFGLGFLLVARRTARHRAAIRPARRTRVASAVAEPVLEPAE
ncbi:PepSY-associated TM helix domain-containing protein [Sphingomonas sp. KR1UV-12]|uniref:PepSY-associated TM helix domain-containing protein n=1 Tax=Sphingomonas aurea TaxID=3063994 RepID=A0ABT9EMG5_9SPHN|nr:PepSY-associated TM helix domain-containing protein [Sphingomonas sp. KR1UV-12]MDP1028154.1 PepSY-associated TM helix domain-containing protein [Sphingomonas sp. KR1UV-12]